MVKDRKIRMIALDLDYTTLRNEKSLSPRTERALREAAAAGVHVVAATGRTFSALPPAILGIDSIRYAVNSNGAEISRLPGRNVIYRNGVGKEQVRAVREMLRDTPFPVEVFRGGQAFANAADLEELAQNGSTYRSAAYILWSRKPVPDVLALLDGEPEDVENISISFPEDAEREKMRARLAKIPGVTITSSTGFNLEIGGATTSKAEALSYLMGVLGVAPEELMACGDSPNDAKMLALAGLGVAMGNASDEMKKLADYVTDTNENDGVAKAIERFVLRAE